VTWCQQTGGGFAKEAVAVMSEIQEAKTEMLVWSYVGLRDATLTELTAGTKFDSCCIFVFAYLIILLLAWLALPYGSLRSRGSAYAR
jgi:hypothetical protein